MQLLIVDDEKSMIEALEKNIRWDRLEFDKVYHACSKEEAIRIFTEFPVDVLLCDIEMPTGSGLELVEWVNGNREGVCCILLTCHAEFSYAKRAVQLGSFDYILKPVQFEKLEAVLQAASEKLKKTRALRQTALYWEEGKKAAMQQFWKDLFVGEIQPDPESIKRYLKQKHLELSVDGVYIPVLLSLRELWNSGTYDKALLQFCLRNIAAELFEFEGARCEVLTFSENMTLVLLLLEEPQEEAYWNENIRNGCSRLVKAVEEHMHMGVGCYIGSSDLLQNIPPQLETLQTIDFNNVILTSNIIFMQEYNARQVRYESRDFAKWEHLMEKRQYEEAEDAILRFLLHHAEKLEIDREFLEKFYVDFYFLLFICAKNESIFLDSLFSGEDARRYSDSARRSLKDMQQWVTYAVGVLKEYYLKNDNGQTPVNKVCQYIHNHIADEISVEELADLVYLNSDYLNRIFKKEKGVSLSKYVILEKIESAKWYLENTDEPIGEIAAHVGYYNYSSFNRVFTKCVGISPREWKNRSGK